MGNTAVRGLDLKSEPGVQEVFITRVFDAPRERVFKAHTDPKLIAQWWGPARYTTVVDKLDARPGGTWRFLNRDADGNEYAFHGVFVEVIEPERITWTFEFEGMPGHISLETVTFEEHEGRTTVNVHSVYQSVDDRDGMLNAGMAEGLSESWDRLAALVEDGS
jgi:uncharacterized protein YndB with AHSA1/START domain